MNMAFKISVPVDSRPSDYEYALLSQHVYRGDELKEGDSVPGIEKWRIVQVKKGKSGYFGVIYINDETQQFVLVHRGTDSLEAILQDFWGIWENKLCTQKEEALVFVKECIELVKEKQSYRLSFTGHSLGGFLAELSVFYAVSYFKYFNVNAVTFESPGSRESMEFIQSNKEPIILDQLDIVGYVSYPNLINTCNKHVGTLFHIEPHLCNRGWVSGWHLIKAHKIDRMARLFEDADNTPSRHYMSDWPLGRQRQIYFDYAKLDNGKYTLSVEMEEEMKEQEEKVKQMFNLTYEGHFKSKFDGYHVLLLRHFSLSIQPLLRDLYEKISFIARRQNNEERLVEELRKIDMPEEIIKYLHSFKVAKDSSGIEYVELDVNKFQSSKIHDFRYKLSNWLNKSGQNIFEKLGSLQNTNKLSPTTVISTIIDEDVKLEKDGALDHHQVHDVDVAIPVGVNEQDIHNLKHMMPVVKEIRSSIIGPNAQYGGHITSDVVTGASTISTSEKKANSREKNIQKENCESGGITTSRE